MTIKTENQIYANIVQFINTALTQLEISGWQVLQLKQPIKLTEIEPTIYVTCTTKQRNGWQMREYPIINNALKHKEKFITEVDVQISALRRRDIEDTVNTMNSADILEHLKAYMLNVNIVKDLRALGYQIYQPSEIQTPDFFDDSDNFEFMPFFSVVFILDNTLISPQASIDGYTYKIKGV